MGGAADPVGVGRLGGSAAARHVSVVRLESRRPAGPRGAIHVPRALVIINLINTKF